MKLVTATPRYQPVAVRSAHSSDSWTSCLRSGSLGRAYRDEHAESRELTVGFVGEQEPT